MEKQKILEHLKKNIQQELDKAKNAYQTSHGHATDNELKADGKYDTRAIEAGYLAGAQKKRVEELEQEVKLLDEIDLSHTNDQVSVGSLVGLSYNNLEKKYFISSTSGGSMFNIDGEIILIISAFSPLGVEAIGLKKGDTFEVQVKNQDREYTITSID